MDFQDNLTSCQNIINKGFVTVQTTNISWLNDFCVEFLVFCNKLHKFLIFECVEKDKVSEIVFLCLNQILCCIKYLERTIRTEENGKTVLISTRQHFLDRILWCFARLTSILNSSNDNVTPSNLEETNFVKTMDEIMDLIAPYSDYKEKENSITKINTTSNSEAIVMRRKLRTCVDSVLSQTLSFANVALPKDKNALSALCQKVLRECIEFEEECSLNNSPINLPANERNLKAVVLENALCQLEDYINESLLRLVFKVYIDYSEHSIDNIRQLIISKPNSFELDEKIADFDCNIDRIMQIGVFALAFASNVQIKTKVRSTLASFESLDSSLIPSLYSNCDLHSNILEEHFHEEVKQFFKSIQEIIDTNAFCTSFLEILEETIKTVDKKFNKNIINETLDMAIMLKENFKINFNDLKIFQNDENQIKYDKFVLMLNECLAILTCANQVEESRIIKRLKIFRSCIKKLLNIILCEKNSKDKRTQTIENNKSVLILSDELSESNKMFESFGISPSIVNILYESSRKRNYTTDSMIGNSSRCTRSPLKFSPNQNEEKKAIKRKISMRTAMFKRQKDNESGSLYKIYNENSTNLHITDILDQLTNLSTTFSKITQINGCCTSV